MGLSSLVRQQPRRVMTFYASMRVNGIETERTEKVNVITQMVLNIKVITDKTNLMVMVSSLGLLMFSMDKFMSTKDIGKMEKWMVVENLEMAMASLSKDSSRITYTIMKIKCF